VCEPGFRLDHALSSHFRRPVAQGVRRFPGTISAPAMGPNVAERGIMTSTNHWDLRLLDGFQLSYAGSCIALKARKGIALLTFLALHRNRLVHRETVAALLWEDADRAQARVSLRQLLSSLRKLAEAGPPIVDVDGDCIRLSDFVRVDADHFEALADGAPEVQMAACEVYRSDLLANFHLRDAPAFHDWLIIEQTRLRNRYVAVLAEVMESACAEGGDLNLGMSAALRLVRIDPYNELGHRNLMRIYARQGRSALAIHQYRSLAALLRRELQVAPEAATTGLYEHLVQRRRKQDDVPAAPARESFVSAGPTVAGATCPLAWRGRAGGAGTRRGRPGDQWTGRRTLFS
jgi:DNA-binding SARP family transcriptional activator